MSDLAPVLTNCAICRHPLVEQINTRIRDHGILPTMRWLGEQGIVDKVWHRNTFSAHKNEHMTTDFEKQRMAAALKLRKQQRTIRVDTTDLAALLPTG